MAVLLEILENLGRPGLSTEIYQAKRGAGGTRPNISEILEPLAFPKDPKS